MIYRDFKGLKLSGLGLGCMRLPVLDGDETRVDFARAEQIIDYAYAHGVNYFDTAYAYHGGNSEAVIGRALAKYPRESFFLADKFPGYDRGNLGRIDEIFNEQLRRCGVDYFDFYLCHNVYEPDIDGYLAPEYGLLDYLAEQKRAGRIRHLGFSCHGALPVLERFLDAGGDRLEFCQIQLNYVDWSLQRAEEKAKLLNSRGVPVWVMEPVRGGKLASLPEGLPRYQRHRGHAGGKAPGRLHSLRQLRRRLSAAAADSGDLREAHGAACKRGVSQGRKPAHNARAFTLCAGISPGPP